MIYKNIFVDRPEGTKIQPKNGVDYVYRVIESNYKSDKQYVVEKRVLIGRMNDDKRMNPNDNYFTYYKDSEVVNLLNQPEYSDTVSIGNILAVDKIIKDLGLDKCIIDNINSSDIDGVTSLKIIADLATYFIVFGDSAVQHYDGFARKHAIFNNKIIDDTFISNFFKEQITDTKIQKFLKEWCKLNYKKEGIYLSYDSTNINTSSNGITLAEYGYAKDNDEIPQVNISYALDQSNNIPLFYETYRGSINDSSEFEYMIKKAEEFGITKVNFIVDRGYFSKKNIADLLLKNHDYLMMVKTNIDIAREKIDKIKNDISRSANYIGEHQVFGITLEGFLFNDSGYKTYFHIYQDEIRKNTEKLNLLNYIYKLRDELDNNIGNEIKTLERYNKYFTLEVSNRVLVSYAMKNEEIDKEIENYGFFCLISSKNMSAEEALNIYRKRDQIENVFRMLKTELNYDTYRVHSDKSLFGKTFVMFITGIIRNEIMKRLKPLLEKDRKNYTVNGAIKILEEIEISKNSKDEYVSRYALTAKQRKVLNALNIKEKAIRDITNLFNSRF